MENVEIKPYTIIISDNKRTCEDVLIPFFESHEITHKYFSSGKMSIADIESAIDDYTSYPINTDIIIVFLNKIDDVSNIIIISKKNNYSVIGFSSKIKKHKGFKEIYKSIGNISYSENNNYAIIKNNKTVIISDVHGCLDELIECLTDNKGISYNKETGKLIRDESVPFYQIIINGDFIDKGKKIKETIEFLYCNKDFFIFSKGNHEYWVYQYLNKKLDNSKANNNLIKKYFNTILLLKKDEELKKKFFELYEMCYDFLISDNFIVTHAPCEKKYLGKSDKKSLQAQRNFIYPKRMDYKTKEDFIKATKEAFGFLKIDADETLPYHIFGHVPFASVIQYKNKISIDTGCVQGNALSCVLIDGDNFPVIQTYKSKKSKLKIILNFFGFKRKKLLNSW